MNGNKKLAISIRIVVPVIACFILFGCGKNADERYDSGYSDGYAEGYNTTCKIRATLVDGDWEDKDYSRGYREGQSAGATACREKK